MSIAIVQSRFVTSTNGNGTTHDLPFAGATTPGNTLLALLLGVGEVTDITGATINGVAGPPSATQDYSTAFAAKTARAYRYSNAASGATGFRFTLSAAHFDLSGWILELSGVATAAPFTAGGTFPDDFGPVELDATASVNAAGDAAFAMFSDVPLANITATRSGFTQSSDSNGSLLLQRNLSTGPTSANAGASLSSNGFSTCGYVVTYKAAAAAGAATKTMHLHKLMRA